MTEIGSIMENKLIANLFFIPEYNTVKQFNCNGINIQKLSSSKLNLFYKIRLFPTILFIATIVADHSVYDTDAAIRYALQAGMIPVVPPKKNRKIPRN